MLSAWSDLLGVHKNVNHKLRELCYVQTFSWQKNLKLQALDILHPDLHLEIHTDKEKESWREAYTCQFIEKQILVSTCTCINIV